MKIYFDYLKLHFKSILEYKLSFILSLCSQVFVFFTYYFLIIAMFLSNVGNNGIAIT